jgi:LacI family transcriptional regulator, gluconate utilization system Gnt-I transcriptional repressor
LKDETVRQKERHANESTTMNKPRRMADIAREAGVSTMTVSRAFKRDASVSPETRERILEVAERMGYVFDSMASNLRSQRSGFVAVTVPTVNNPNFAETLDALSRELAQGGLQVLLGYDRYDMAEEEAIVEQLLRRRPEAFVATGGRHTDRARRLLKASGVPVVETWDSPETPIEHVVGFSNAASMELVVDHLAARGLRDIAFIGGDFSDDTRGADRRRGFVAAMERRGLDASRLIPIAGPSSVAKGAAAMAQILETRPRIEAVVGVFDHAAFGALTECQRRGIRVPEDVAIAGFGATEVARLTVPSLTTVDPHCAEIGRRAGRLIVDILRHPERETGPIRIEIEPVLRIAESTG